MTGAEGTGSGAVVSPAGTRPGVGDPVHTADGGSVRWSRVNFAEAVQGVQTPLGWGFWGPGLEGSLRGVFHRFGVLGSRELRVPREPSRRFAGIFFGRVAGNVDAFRAAADRMPGSSGDQVEEKVFGVVPSMPQGRKPVGALTRYPVVALRAPPAIMVALHNVPRARREYYAWWRRCVLESPPDDLEGARALMSDAARRFVNALTIHGVPTFVSGPLLEALTHLAERAAGDPSLGLDLATGFGGMEETELIADVHRAATGELTIDELVLRHGVHGPAEGDLSSASWREDAKHVEMLIANHQRAGDADPRRRERFQRERRRNAERRLMAGLPSHLQPAARAVMWAAARYIPLREVGKATFLHAVDGGRCAARVAGRILAARGVIDDPEDVFFLTLPEFEGVDRGRLRDLVTERKRRDAHHRSLELPFSWTGNPDPTGIGSIATGERGRVEGVGVFGGTATGRARVITDPLAADLEPGDILVCPTTDPSWTPLFTVAGAVVIDTGGAVSHGAIVARELGVTSVIGTRTGTRVIPDGATVRVDGASGCVTIVGAG